MSILPSHCWNPSPQRCRFRPAPSAGHHGNAGGLCHRIVLLVPLGDRFDRKSWWSRTCCCRCWPGRGGVSREFAGAAGGDAAGGFDGGGDANRGGVGRYPAAPAQRGKVVGSVTSGIVMGILLARLVSGIIADIAGWRAVYDLSRADAADYRAADESDTCCRSAEHSHFRGRAAGVCPRLFVTEPLLRQRGALALLILPRSACCGVPWFCRSRPCRFPIRKQGCLVWLG